MREEARPGNISTAHSTREPAAERLSIWSRRSKPLGIVMLHAEDILKGEAMISGPSCPLRLGVLDSPDYWTDDALMSAVRPLNPEELHHLAVGSQQRRNQQRGPRYTR